MADNYLESRHEEYLRRKEKAEKLRRDRFRKQLESYRKKIAAGAKEDSAPAVAVHDRSGNSDCSGCSD